jgi:hypothetical protein
MLGEGARMIFMALFHQNWFYQPNTFDLFFDWVPLTILGSLIFYEGVKSFYVESKAEQIRSKEITVQSVKKERGNRLGAAKSPK